MRPVLLLVFAAAALACDSSEPATDRDLPASGAPGAQPPPRVDASTDGGQDAAVEAGASCGIFLNATVSATLKISVDDNFKLYVNGTLVKEFTGTWESPQTETITLNRHPSKKNVIAVEGINLYEISGLDRMILADIMYAVDTKPFNVVTDMTWKQTSTLTAGWFDLDFVDNAWPQAVEEGKHGDPPYNSVLGTSSAKYIWSFDSGTTDTSAKPDSESVYFRKTFYLDMAGAPQATPGACP